MSTRKEMREVIDNHVDDGCHYPDRECEWRGGGYCRITERAYECLMKRLTELGVVIKVENSWPISCGHAQMTATRYSQKATCPLFEKGYVAVESLIGVEDGKSGEETSKGS